MRNRTARRCFDWLAAFCLLAGMVSVGTAQTPRQYNFGTNTRVIDVGYGLFATPMSVLGEVMRRDKVMQLQAEQAGLVFRFHPYEKGIDTLKDIIEGKLDASMPTDVVVLNAIVQTPVVLAGYVRQSFSSVIGPKNWRMADLKGKRIGNSAGTSGHNALLHGLDGAGLSEKDVNLVQMNVSDMPNALLAGQIDAFAAFEPTPSSLLRQHGGRFAALHKQISPAYFMLTGELVSKHPEGSRILIASLHRAIRWLGKSRDNLGRASRWALVSMREFTGQEPSITEKEISQFTRSDLLDIAGAPRIPVNESETGSALHRNFKFLKKSGKLLAGATWQQVQMSFNRELGTQMLQNARRCGLDEFDYAP